MDCSSVCERHSEEGVQAMNTLKRGVSVEVYLGGLSIVMAVGFIDVGSLLSFFKGLRGELIASNWATLACFLFLASYAIFFATVVLALVPAWRTVYHGEDLPVDRAVTLFGVALVAVVVSYASMFLLSVRELGVGVLPTG